MRRFFATSLFFCLTLFSCASRAPQAERLTVKATSLRPTLMASGPVHQPAPTGYIIGEIGRSDIAVVIATIEKAKEIGSTSILIRIDSEGGSVGAAEKIVGLFDLARESNLKVNCVVDGSGYSAAFYILQSCDRRFMTKRSTLMAHAPIVGGNDPDGGISGVEKENRDNALTAISRGFAEQCSSRLKVSFADYTNRTREGRQWWFDWQQALAFTAVDQVVSNASEVPR